MRDQGLHKGSMALIDESAGATASTTRMGPAIEISGGSAANTTVGIATLGGRAAYIGKVKDDQLGAGVHARHPRRRRRVRHAARARRPADGALLILVTPDAQRTMNTFLGAAPKLDPDDIDQTVAIGAAVTYLEGYLWDPRARRRRSARRRRAAHEAGRDGRAHSVRPVLRRPPPRRVPEARARAHVDLLFANERSCAALYETADFETAVARRARTPSSPS